MAEAKLFPFTAAVGIDSAANYVMTMTEIEASMPGAMKTGQLAVGLLMSEKTGLLGIPNRHGEIYPTFESAERIAQTREYLGHLGHSFLSVILHYNSDNPKEVSGQLHRALAPIDYGIDAIQINGLYPGRESLRLQALKQNYPKMPILLQIHKWIFDDYKRHELAEDIGASYRAGAMDGVWLDASGGEGKSMDAEKLISYIKDIRQAAPSLRIGVAGNLNADNLEEKITPILAVDSNISWDAQTGVQDEHQGKRSFSVTKSIRFLVRSAELRQQFASNV